MKFNKYKGLRAMPGTKQALCCINGCCLLPVVCGPGLRGHFLPQKRVLWEDAVPSLVSQGKTCLLGSISLVSHAFPKRRGSLMVKTTGFGV